MKIRTISLLLALAAAARAMTLNFDGPGLTNLVIVSNQYPGVTFSAGAGDVVMISAQNPPYEGSGPNMICTGTAVLGGARISDCTHDLLLTFTNPVDDLSFGAYGNQTPAGQAFAFANLTFSDGSSLTDIPLIVSHTDHCASPINDCAVDQQSLPYVGITSLLIHDNRDPAGTGYDDFTFTPGQFTSTPGQAPGAPEPSTIALIATAAIFGLGSSLSRRRSDR